MNPLYRIFPLQESTSRNYLITKEKGDTVSSTKDKGYITLNFDELNEKGLDKLKKAISKSGYEVVKIIPAGTARRKDGIPVKLSS